MRVIKLNPRKLNNFQGIFKMLVKTYVIFDVKAKFYNKPFFLQNDSVAIRAFTDLANDPNSDVCKHPTDFILFSLGTYDDETAKLSTTEPLVLARAHELKKPESVYKEMIEATEPKNKE